MKQGFTLVELLAVLIILSVISLISVPVITSTLEKSNQTTTLESARELIKIASSDVVDKNYDIPYQYRVENHTLNYKNGNFTSGLIVITNGNNSFVENLSTPKYCINGSLYDLKITKGKCNTATYTNYKSSIDVQKSYPLQNSNGTSSGLYLDDFTGEYYFKGNVTNNYVTYAGLTWRIVSFKQGMMKLVSQSVIDEDSKNYSGALSYLNGSFYANLKQKDYLVSSTYSVGYVGSVGTAEDIIAAEQTDKENHKVGLLTLGEYKRSMLGTSTFLTNGTTWILTKKDSTTGYYLSSSSINTAALTTTYTLRPVIVLNAAAVYKGDGTNSSPYVVR